MSVAEAPAPAVEAVPIVESPVEPADPSVITIAGVSYRLQDYDLNRGAIVSELGVELIATAPEAIADMAAFRHDYQEKTSIYLSPEKANSDEWRAELEALDFDEEMRNEGIKLRRSPDPYAAMIAALPSLGLKAPHLVFDFAAACLVPNFDLACKAKAGGQQSVRALVAEWANALRYGSEKNDWKGADVAELEPVIRYGFEQFQRELALVRPLLGKWWEQVFGPLPDLDSLLQQFGLPTAFGETSKSSDSASSPTSAAASETSTPSPSSTT